MNSIKIKLIVIYAAVILIVMIVSGTVMLVDMRNMEIERTREQLSERARAIYVQIVQLYEREDFSRAAAWTLLGHREYEIQGMIMTERGIPIAPEPFVGMHINNQAVMAAWASEIGFSVGRPGPDLDGIDQQWISFAMPVSHNGENFIVYTRISTMFMNESLSRVAFTLVIMVLISIVVTLIMWFFLANTITSPIVSLTRHAKAIASGDFSGKISAKSNDEIGQLIVDFNHMQQELSGSLINITSERNKREAILQNTSHGVLAYDAAGSLTHANNASIELLPKVEIKKLGLQDILTFLGLDPQEVYSLKPEEIREITFQDNDYFILACVTSYASGPGSVDGYIIVLQDVSRQMKLENMRKEFVANVSHELRTPLTSIRTYAETLIEGALDDRETATNFLKVIDEEAQRMTLLVSDLLELSRIDSKQSALEMDVIDLVALLRLAVRQSQVLASTKSQTIEIEASSTPCFIEANASRINQVVTNILTNAIKYSPENTTISVTMEIADKYFNIFVKDQGMGIPEENLPRIFERFYRVDKARARAMGGTGLGLAIVKEIMVEHGGQVDISSRLGEGTTIVLRFNRPEL